MSSDNNIIDEERETKHQLDRALRMVRQEPTHINYWNAFKRIQGLSLRTLQIPDDKRVKIALLSSFTIDPLGVYIDIETRLIGLYPEVYIAPFDQYRQEILNDASALYAFAPDVIILAITDEEEDFHTRFVTLSKEQREQHQTEMMNRLTILISELSSRTNALILVNNFVVPSFSVLGILDNKNNMGLRDFFRQLNQMLANLYRDSKQVYIVDLDLIASDHGKSRCLNPRMYYMGRFGFSESFLPAISGQYLAYIKALKNKTRKCIVLDLDNTLWGGVLGEEGFEGIQLGKDPPGNAYVDFQRLLLSYYHRGIILAVNSNNNYDDAIRVIRDHPSMVLRENHFAAMRINWENKAQNMIELAKEINIGLDSMVFLDDLPQNREEIKEMLPQVLVVDMPGSPYLYKQAFEKLNDFNVLSLTEEDTRRGEMYYAQKMRERLRKSETSLEDFLRSLEIKAVIKPADPFMLPRIARLVNKTNQFNLTTRRYTDIEITKMAQNGDEYAVLGLSLTDKFGDEGTVAAAIIRKSPQTWTIDSFLMSCRVIGRKVETAFLAKIVTSARNMGASKVIGEYIPTEKNQVTKNFYSNHGFEMFEEQDDLSRWRLDLAKSSVKIPEWVKINDD